MPHLEAFSKRAAITSLLAIVILQPLVHPDATWSLRAMTCAALVVGWVGASARRDVIHTAWLIAAPLAPAALRAITGRSSEPLVDIVWMAGVAGVVLRTISWTRWSFPPLWSVLLGGWALTLSLAWPVLAARELAFTPGLLRDPGAINSWAGLLAPHVVTWTFYVVATQLLGVLWFDWIYREATARGLPRAAHGLWIGVTLASVVAVIQGAVDLRFLNTEQWAELRRAGGTMLNPNAYGVAAACAGPVAFVLLRAWRRGATAMGAVVLGVNWLGVWMSGSRTALVAAAAGAAGLAIALWRLPRAEPGGSGEPARPRRTQFVSALAGAAIVGALVVGSIADPFERLAEIPLTRDGLNTLRERGTYAAIAGQITREYPLTGVGAGAFHYLAPDYERADRDEFLPFDNAQNWWRHQLAELGVLGGAPVLVWSALAGWRVLRPRAASSGPGRWTARALLAGVGVVSLLGIPTQSPVVLLWFFLLVAWLAAPDAGTSAGGAPATPRAAWIVVTLLAVAYAGGHLLLAAGPLSVAERARRFNREYVAGTYGLESLDGRPRFRWVGDEARFLIPARTRWMMLRLWAHHPDIAQQPVRARVTTACGVLFERDLTSTEPVTLLVEFPPAGGVFDATVSASRTWRPSDAGAADSRRLGVAVLVDFDQNGQIDAPHERLPWPACAR